MSDRPIRILHLGLGRFHRAHQAVYMERMAHLGDASWGISAFSMRSPDARDHMRAVELRYPVVETENAAKPDTPAKDAPEVDPGYNTIWIESIREVGFAIDDRELLLARIRDAGVKIITLTITEKGYNLTPTGDLNLENPEVKNDLADPLHPKTAVGILGLLFRERALHGRRPLSVVSCDNLRENGRKLEKTVRTYLSRLSGDDWDKALDFVADDVSFPSSMVDRIVPELSEQTKAAIEAASGTSHPELLATEEFTQWVIEDRFVGGRPSWDRVFVDFVRDIRPFEEMKLRLLNATHSMLAYLGTLRGHSFVHEAISDPFIEELARKMMFEEVSPLLEKFHRKDRLAEYCERLIARFRNEKLPHRLLQIAADGSEKIQQRILPSLVEAGEGPHSALVMALASWILFLHKRMTGGFEIADPRATKLKGLMTTDLSAFAEKVLKEPEWMASLSNNEKLRKETLAALGAIQS